MREIKFRGKRKDNGEWVYGDIHFNANCSRCHIHERGEKVFESYNVIPETIGQFTGKKDKNDVEVWDGNKVKWSWDRSHKDIEGVIEWDNKNLQWIITNTYFEHNRQVPLSNYSVEVIGNIHERIEQ